MASDSEVLARTERWFIARGIPHFIHHYSASRDVFTRTLPALTLVAVLELVGALNLSWPWWANVLAVAGGIGILVGAFALSNVLRKRPAFSRPERVGPGELAVFVLAPALVPLVFGAQEGSAAAVAGLNVVLLAVIYAGTSYAVVPMTRWAAGRMRRQLGSIFGLMLRALPLLLLFATFLFLTAEVWQVAADLHGPFFWVTIGLFVMVGTVFLVGRLPHEIGRLSSFDGWDEVMTLVNGTPAEGVAPQGDLETGLSRRQWGNVGLVVVFSQGMQIALVSVSIGLFFVAFGLLTVTPDVVRSWSGGQVNVLADFELWGRVVIVTEELLRVAAFLTAFSGLYFTVSLLTDATYRREFFEEVVGEVRQACAVRAVYLTTMRA